MTAPAPTQHNTPDVKRWTGVAALAVAVLLLTEFVMHQVAGPRPELDQKQALAEYFVTHHQILLTIVLTDTILMSAVLIFLAAFRQVVTHARVDLQWIADLGFAAGVIFVAVTLVGDAMEAGSALDVVHLDPDPSAIRALTEGHAVMFGATGCVLLAVVSASSAYVVIASGVLPRWSGIVAWVIAGLQLFGLVTIFGGTSDLSWFSSGGPGVTATATFPWLAWVIVVGIVTVRGDAELRERRDRARERRKAAAEVPTAEVPSEA